MKNYIKVINNLPLFTGIKETDLEPMLKCLGSYIREYKKDEFIFLADAPIKCVGIILTGKVHMIKEDVWGDKTVLAFLKEGNLFGETFACGDCLKSQVTFYAPASCKVLFMPFHKVIHACNMSCVFHHRLIENMVTLIANKNVLLMEKVEIISRKTLREKILTYLALQSKHEGKTTFKIPLGRVELAQFLCADRSALTRELNSMQEEQLILFKKDIFTLL